MNTPEYYAWENMIRRCGSPTCPSYSRYGKRGIKVCRRWHVFVNFLADIGYRPSKDHTLERIDNNGHYVPSNCKWATRKEQARNTRRNRLITANGETLTHTEWSVRLGGDPSIVRDRIRRGWPELDAVTKPIDRRSWITRRRNEHSR